MCGRYLITSSFEAMARLFEAAPSDLGVDAPRPNVSPTQSVPVAVSAEDGRHLVPMRWGFVPHWAKAMNEGPLLINARAETLAEKPAFRAAARERRCLIPADGFYEWQKRDDAKTPYFISQLSGEPFGLAGLWESWTDKETGESLQTTTLITTAANEFMAPLHHRMPVVLTSATADSWFADPARLLDDIAARTPELQAWPVDRRVNNARNESPELIEPAGDILR